MSSSTSCKITDEQRDLVAKYRPRTTQHRFDLFNTLDRHFAQSWKNHSDRLLSRKVLDPRKRLLTLVGQYTMLRDTDALRETLEACVDLKLNLEEPLEIILQCYIYGGERIVASAAEVYASVMTERGQTAMLKGGRLALDATSAGRSLDKERESWSSNDREDPRLAELLERYGWYGISTGLRLRPGHHLNLITTLDAVDHDFLDVWLETLYERMEVRRVLDDATRLLCTVASTLSIGETHQSRRHMRGALRQGATPREIIEVIFQTCLIIGHPYLMPAAIDDFLIILDEEKRLGEVIAADKIDEIRRIVHARTALHSGVGELGATPR